MKPKIIAMYLPQYHSIPENDEFWGKGFTDWVTVKKAKPLFKWHDQPKEPLNDNYYDLSIKENVKWQAELAKEYGIFGFGVYHYWFNNEKNLLTKPAEIIRDNDDIPINYFLAWDNANWKRSWSNIEGNAWAPIADSKNNQGPQILIKYIIGKEPDWENHYNYVRSHFLNEKYIKINNMPVFVILQYSHDIERMCEYWNNLAIRDGFSGVHFIFKYKSQGRIHRKSVIPETESQFVYQPNCSGWIEPNLKKRIFLRLKRKFPIIKRANVFNYDSIWESILKDAKSRFKAENIILGAFVSYDDSPRRGIKGTILKGASPAKFKKYMKSLLEISSKQNKDMIFLTAWNEWGEGAILEPDKRNGFAYLDVIKELTTTE